VARELVVPVMRDGRIMAMIGVGNKPENYTRQDIETVAIFADLIWDIAERKRDEEAQRDSERKLLTLIDLNWKPVWQSWRKFRRARFLTTRCFPTSRRESLMSLRASKNSPGFDPLS
jgi:hypothetical protein